MPPRKPKELKIADIGAAIRAAVTPNGVKDAPAPEQAVTETFTALMVRLDGIPARIKVFTDELEAPGLAKNDLDRIKVGLGALDKEETQLRNRLKTFHQGDIRAMATRSIKIIIHDLTGETPTSRARLNSASVLTDAGERVIKIGYWPWQLEVRREILNGGVKIAALPCGARAGKDGFCNRFVFENSIRLSDVRRHNGSRLAPLVNNWVVTPTRSLYADAWAVLESLVPPELIARKDRARGEYELKGGIRYSFKSSHKPETLVAEGVDHLIFSEASRDKSLTAWTESCVPRLASPGRLGIGLPNGTPRVGKGHWFRQLCDGIIRGDIHNALVRRVPTWANPEMVCKIVGLRENMTKRLFDCEIGAEWPDDDEQPFRESDVDAMMETDGPAVTGPYVSGLDVGRSKAHTALVTMAGGDVPEVVAGYELMGKLPTQIPVVLEYARRWEGLFAADSTGIGGFFCDQFVELATPGTVERVDFNGGRREMLLDMLIAAVEQRAFRFRRDLLGPLADRIRAQLLAVECEVGDSGEACYGSRELMDFVMALALCWYRASRLKRRGVKVGLAELMRGWF